MPHLIIIGSARQQHDVWIVMGLILMIGFICVTMGWCLLVKITGKWLGVKHHSNKITANVFNSYTPICSTYSLDVYDLVNLEASVIQPYMLNNNLINWHFVLREVMAYLPIVLGPQGRTSSLLKGGANVLIWGLQFRVGKIIWGLVYLVCNCPSHFLSIKVFSELDNWLSGLFEKAGLIIYWFEKIIS